MLRNKLFSILAATLLFLPIASSGQIYPIPSKPFSQIPNGGNYNSTTDNVLTVRNGKTDVLTRITATGGTGTVTDIETTSPISGGPINTTGTISCPTCTVNPSGSGNSGGNSCAGYSNVIACALGIGYSDPRLQYDSPQGSVYTAARCDNNNDDAPGFNNAFHFTKVPVLDPTNGSGLSGQGGSVKCTWVSSLVLQDDGFSVFHFPQKSIYNDTVDNSSLQVKVNNISQQNMVTTTVNTTSGSPTATVGSCAGIVQFGDLYDLPAIPAGASVTSCSGTTLTMTANATATHTGDALYVLFPRIAPYNCVVNLHGHVNASFSYENFRGQDVGNIFGANAPVGGSAFICNDVNSSGQSLPLVNMDHSSVRQMGDVFGSSINIASGLATGLLGNNLLELRVTDSVFSSVGYVANGNTSDATFIGNEMTGQCGAIAGLANNVRIHDNRIESTSEGGNCFGIFGAGNQYAFGTIRLGWNFVIGNAMNSITGNQFQENGGPAIELTGFDGQPNTGPTVITGNTFSDDASGGVATKDADIVFDNATGFSTTNVTITGNAFLSNNGAYPNYNIGFYGTGDDFVSVIGNTFGTSSHKLATYNFSTETPAHIKSSGNSGDPDFQQGTNVGYCKVTSALSAFDLQACVSGLIIPNFSTASRPTCSSTILGEIYYDTTLSNYEACQGSSPAWSAVGSGGGGSGTVTSVSVVTANGISGSVATATTTPAITLTLGNITPANVTPTGIITVPNGGTFGTCQTTASCVTLPTAGPSNYSFGTAFSLGYAQGSGEYFADDAAGDVALIDALGQKIRLGINNGSGTGNSTMQIAGSSVGIRGTQINTANSTQAFAVGQNGATNPTFNVDSSFGSAVTGISVATNSAGSGVKISATSSGTNESINISPKGTGIINNTGGFTSAGATTLSALSTGGVVHNSSAGLLSTSLVGIADLSATGTPSSTTFLRGDNSWSAPISLTTTGTSGAATFISGTLNIPNYASSGTGTVTSAGYTGDGVIFNSVVSGSPITTSGTFAPALLTQNVNTVLAGPASGSSAAPSFRALSSNDLPLTNAQLLQYFGDGSDGNVTVSSGTTTLLRDMYYNNLTVSGTGSIVTGGFRIFIAGTLDITAAPANAISASGKAGGNSTAASAGTAGTQLTAGTLGSGNAGSAGTAGGTGVGAIGTAGSNSSPSLGGSGGASGVGGSGTSGAGGTNHGGGTATVAVTFNRWEANFIRGVTLELGGAGGYGGSSGAGDGTNSGGGGGGAGSAGGIAWISANTINRGASTAVGAISANGGTSGNGGSTTAGNTGGGGGAAGPGAGSVWLAFESLTGSSASNAVQAIGGVGGAGGNGLGTGTGGNGGGAGAGGIIDLLNLGTGVLTTQTGPTVVAGSTHSGLTGGGTTSPGANALSL